MEWHICVRNLVLPALTMALLVAANGNCYEGGDSGGKFVQRSGTHFIMNGKRVYLNGFNAYWLMYMASDPSTRSKVTTTLQQASLHGLNVARTWAFSDGGYKALQVSPGSYDENVFRGLDFVISEAGKYGVRLILSLVNNWKDFGGKNQYVKWASERGQISAVSNEDGFFTHLVVKQYYKNHIKAVLTRRNTITGVAYKDDPAVFAWELMNEPRSDNDHSGKIIQDWVSEMAAYVKSIDSNHLLEIGLEGFYGESMPNKKLLNPGYQLVGTDFISNNRVPHIDFATVHLYPDQWVPGSNESAQAAFVDKWVDAHIEDCNHILGKPILLSEFGKSTKSEGYSVEKRDKYFQKLYDAAYGSARSGGSCGGGLFWQAMAQGMDGFHDGYEVMFQDSSSTVNIIRQQSQRMSALNQR
ncbi:mannan endo-1,4-beta-mannosidase 4-like [Prosopis cineraria]|uniref:mannan endo-1,4-beta-mannosidase 4-like n=1 Tax=Prosopis cineraria TaxID=364024 RepID=UPI00240EB91F|nr:mannan endo-1,4-beta-mannosidase 4-like [Prosopis cineraria]XP_054777560.1 mannan endo-1,4-beta-mannosidase 4-like [Prosopis cineraria]